MNKQQIFKEAIGLQGEQLNEGVLANLGKAVGSLIHMPFAVFTNMMRAFFGKNKEMDGHSAMGRAQMDRVVASGNLSGLGSELKKGKEVLFSIWYPTSKAVKDNASGLMTFKKWDKLPIDLVIPNRILLAYNVGESAFDVSKIKDFSLNQISLSLAHIGSSDEKIVKIYTPTQYMNAINGKLSAFDNGMKLLKDAIKENMVIFAKMSYDEQTQALKSHAGSGNPANAVAVTRGEDNGVANALGAHSLHTWFWGLDKEFLNKDGFSEISQSIDAFVEFIKEANKRYKARIMFMDGLARSQSQNQSNDSQQDQNQPEQAQQGQNANQAPAPTPTQTPSQPAQPAQPEHALMQGLLTFGDLLNETSMEQDTLNTDDKTGGVAQTQNHSMEDPKTMNVDEKVLMKSTVELMAWVQLNFTWVPAYDKVGIDKSINNKKYVFQTSETSRKISLKYLFAHLVGSAVLATNKQHVKSISGTEEDLKAYEGGEGASGAEGASEGRGKDLEVGKGYEFVFKASEATGATKPTIAFKVIKEIEPKNGFTKAFEVESTSHENGASAGTIYTVHLIDRKQAVLYNANTKIGNGEIIEPVENSENGGEEQSGNGSEQKGEEQSGESSNQSSKVNSIDELKKGHEYEMKTIIKNISGTELSHMTFKVDVIRNGIAFVTATWGSDDADYKHATKGSITFSSQSGGYFIFKGEASPQSLRGHIFTLPEKSGEVADSGSNENESNSEVDDLINDLDSNDAVPAGNYVFTTDDGKTRTFDVSKDPKTSKDSKTGDITRTVSDESGNDVELVAKKTDKGFEYSLDGKSGKFQRKGDSVDAGSDLSKVTFEPSNDMTEEMGSAMGYIPFSANHHGKLGDQIEAIGKVEYSLYKDENGKEQSFEIPDGNLEETLSQLITMVGNDEDELIRKVAFVTFFQLIFALVYVHGKMTSKDGSPKSMNQAIADVLGQEYETNPDTKDGSTGADSYPTVSFIDAYLGAVFHKAKLDDSMIHAISNAVEKNQDKFAEITDIAESGKGKLSQVKLFTEQKSWLDSAMGLV